MDLAHLGAIGMPHVRCLGARLLATQRPTLSWVSSEVAAAGSTAPAPVIEPPTATTASTAAAPTHGAEGGEDVDAVKQRMEGEARTLGLRSARFLSVEPHYYERPLEWRCERLGAGGVEELCKSVVMENTKLDPAADAGRVRCILVIVQYVAKLNKEKLMAAVRALEAERGLPALGKKQYNMRLLEGEACAALTGFGHNAVTPLGLSLPMVLSHEIAALPSGAFWLGGGHVDLKLQLSVEEATSVLGAVVADVTA